MTVFGEVLRNSRLRAALTQEELAERAGLSVRAIGKLESGETTRPRPATVRMLADALGLEEPELALFTSSAFSIRQLVGDWIGDAWPRIDPHRKATA